MPWRSRQRFPTRGPRRCAVRRKTRTRFLCTPTSSWKGAWGWQRPEQGVSVPHRTVDQQCIALESEQVSGHSKDGYCVENCDSAAVSASEQCPFASWIVRTRTGGRDQHCVVSHDERFYENEKARLDRCRALTALWPAHDGSGGRRSLGATLRRNGLRYFAHEEGLQIGLRTGPLQTYDGMTWLAGNEITLSIGAGDFEFAGLALQSFGNIIGGNAVIQFHWGPPVRTTWFLVGIVPYPREELSFIIGLRTVESRVTAKFLHRVYLRGFALARTGAD